MNPEQVVQEVFDIIRPLPSPLTIETVDDSLQRLGVPKHLANLAYSFLQTACARAFFQGMGVEFSPLYQLVDENGKVFESGALADNVFFQKASQLIADAGLSTPALKDVTLMSAEFNAVNELLLQGSKVENIRLLPIAVIVEGKVRSQADRATPEENVRMRTKRWWKFW